jgi:hypothetical protein
MDWLAPNPQKKASPEDQAHPDYGSLPGSSTENGAQRADSIHSAESVSLLPQNVFPVPPKNIPCYPF